MGEFRPAVCESTTSRDTTIGTVTTKFTSSLRLRAAHFHRHHRTYANYAQAIFVEVGLGYSGLLKCSLRPRLCRWNHSRSPAGSRRVTKKNQEKRIHSCGNSFRIPGWDIK